MAKKFMTLERLQEYDDLIKAKIAEDDTSTLSAAKSYTDTSVSNITNGTTVVAEAEHATTADSATTATSATSATTAEKLGSETVGSTTKPIYLNNGVATAGSTYAGGTKVTLNGSAKGGSTASFYAPTSAGTSGYVLTSSGTGAPTWSELDTYSTSEIDTLLESKSSTSHNHDSAYDTKGAAATALSDAKTYADSAAAAVKDDLLNGAGDAYDTLSELATLITDNTDAIEALEIVATGKANAVHTHTVSNISDLTATAAELNYMDGVTSNVQTQLDAKQPTITGGATTIASSNLTANRALISNGSGKVAVSNVTSTELGYLDGVTSAIQAQLDGKADSDHEHSDYASATHTHNNYASTVTITGNGNAITSISQSGNTITATKGSTFLTAHPTITKSDDSTSTATPSFGGTFTAIDSITKDSNGHITKVNTKTVTVPSSTATDSAAGLMTAAMVTKLNGIATGATKVTVDSALSSSSTNPVQNKVVNSAISNLTSAVSANTSSISAHSTSITNLQTEIDNISEITSAEIQALFA